MGTTRSVIASSAGVGSVVTVDIGGGMTKDLKVMPNGWLEELDGSGDYPPGSFDIPENAPVARPNYVLDAFSGAMVPQGQEFYRQPDGTWRNSLGEVHYPAGTTHTVIDTDPLTGFNAAVDKLVVPGATAPAPQPGQTLTPPPPPRGTLLTPPNIDTVVQRALPLAANPDPIAPHPVIQSPAVNDVGTTGSVNADVAEENADATGNGWTFGKVGLFLGIAGVGLLAYRTLKRA